MPKKVKQLTQHQIDKIDKLIANNAKSLDIMNELVGKMGADARAVAKYVRDNNTLQSMLNMVTRHARNILTAGTEAERKKIVDKIKALAKKGIKMLQAKAGQ